jgi:hypothetical protein
MSFFHEHPKIHHWIHWAANIIAFVLGTQDKLIASLHILPAESKIPHYFAYVLATLSFSNILLRGVEAEGSKPDPAAPIAETPASSAITSVDKK